MITLCISKPLGQCMKEKKNVGGKDVRILMRVISKKEEQTEKFGYWRLNTKDEFGSHKFQTHSYVREMLHVIVTHNMTLIKKDKFCWFSKQ